MWRKSWQLPNCAALLLREGLVGKAVVGLNIPFLRMRLEMGGSIRRAPVGRATIRSLSPAAMMARGLGSRRGEARQAFCRVCGPLSTGLCVHRVLSKPGRPSGHKFFRPYSCRNRYCPAQHVGLTRIRDLFSLREVGETPVLSSRLLPLEYLSPHQGRSSRSSRKSRFHRLEIGGSLPPVPTQVRMEQFNRCC